MKRKAGTERKTRETAISAKLCIDGQREIHIHTGVGFLDHMLELFAFHGFFDLDIEASGDLNVDAHHTVEDIGIVLGQCFSEALGDRAGIKRYGSSWVPMDETLAHCAIDIGGRPYLVFNCTFPQEKVGMFDTALIEEFLRAFSNHLKANIHVNCPYGKNSHHISEAIFKAMGRALDKASRTDTRFEGISTTKGVF